MNAAATLVYVLSVRFGLKFQNMESSIHTNTGLYVGHKHLKYGSKLHNTLVLVSSGKACKRCIEQKEGLIYLCPMYKESPLIYIEERK